MDFDQGGRRPAVANDRYYRAGAGRGAPRISLLVESAGPGRQDARRRRPGGAESSCRSQSGVNEARSRKLVWVNRCNYTIKPGSSPMLDLIGAMVLTAAIVVNLNATITMMPLSPVQKLTTVTIAGLWIGLAIALATTGIYATQ